MTMFQQKGEGKLQPREASFKIEYTKYTKASVLRKGGKLYCPF